MQEAALLLKKEPVIYLIKRYEIAVFSSEGRWL
jgi:hypothetical protein